VLAKILQAARVEFQLEERRERHDACLARARREVRGRGESRRPGTRHLHASDEHVHVHATHVSPAMLTAQPFHTSDFNQEVNVYREALVTQWMTPGRPRTCKQTPSVREQRASGPSFVDAG
jgi:hypothetical protein